MPVAHHALQNLGNWLARVVAELEIAHRDKIEVRHVPDADYPSDPDSVRVHITTFAPQEVWVTVGWLHNEVTPHYFVNWSSKTGDFCCNEGTPSSMRALFNLGCCIEMASRFQRQEEQRTAGGRA